MASISHIPSLIMSAQVSFLSLSHTKKLRKEKFLSEMNQVIPWDKFVNAVQPHYYDNNVGRPAKDLKLMLKIYFLQQWFDLSDPAVEEEIYDRGSFQKFLCIDLMKEIVPDETTTCKFRHLLEEHKLQEQFLEIVNGYLEEKGFLMKKGTIVDATLIAAPTSTKNKEKKRDPEMSSTRKGNQWYFGMKGHIGVDSDSGIVHSVIGTAAKRHDSSQIENLLHGKEEALFGDKGYWSKKRKIYCRQQDIFWGVSDHTDRHHSLSSSQKKRNRKLSSVRAKVEHPFHIIKDIWKYKKVRYRGIEKNTLQLHTLFALANLYMKRRHLLT